MKPIINEFGKLSDGREVKSFILKNTHGIEVEIINFGATLVSIKTPDRIGIYSDIILGYDTIEEYESDKFVMGSTVGRFANRIGASKFSIDGEEYKLSENRPGYTLHGGHNGFNKKLWSYTIFETLSGMGVQFSYLSEDGEEGFPGNLLAIVKYYLNEDNELKISFDAETDQPTHVNLTNHAYYNLSGDLASSILDHHLSLHSEEITEIDENIFPTGKLLPIIGTELDFIDDMKIGEKIDKVDGGYDFNYVLKGKLNELKFAAEIFEPTSGRKLKLFSTYPAVQFYSGNFLDGTIGKNGKPMDRYTGFCLEPQFYPDSPNKPEFPSTLLIPGEKYHHEIILKFE
ncbi:MAG: galactose mutarotase [Melioribacteraceae bacterium]|nr:galactose mutarotase [Melioribacteraceae bacterium]